MKHNSDTYRAVKDSFWTDILVLDLLPEEKLFYLWLFTNQHLDPCGCYQVAMRTIEYETGLSHESIALLIKRFMDLGRIDYNEQHKEFILLKWKNNNQGFFKAGNANSVKAIRRGMNKINTPHFRQIVAQWLGDVEAPTLAPTLEATPQPLTINLEPITKDLRQQGASERKSSTENQLREYVDENREKLAGLFPDADLGMELEEMVAKYRGVTIGADPAVLVVRWLRNLKKARASPPEQKSKGALREEAAIQAARETMDLLEEMQNGAKQTGADVVAGNDSRSRDRTAFSQASGVVSEAFS
ncbi:MAG: hypothetical protein WCI45_00085 [Desulfuromonadales bacterium]